MRRLYLHFYAFILLAVVGLGWSLEQIWRVQSEAPPEIPAWVQPFAQSVVLASQNFDSAQALSEFIGTPVQIRPVMSVGWPQAQREALARGEVVPLFNAEQQLVLYLQRDYELWQIGPVGDPVPQPTYWYQTLFVVLLVLLATLWIVPLARDLRRLEKHLSQFPQHQDQVFELPASSLIKNIANSFNAMRQQIQHLLGLQRELTRAVSHDLRTPLARMKFAIAMRSEQGDDLAALAEDVTEMEQLVGTLLDYAKMESQEDLLTMSDVNLSELCMHIVEKLNAMPGVPIRIVATNEIRCLCDGHYMERALQNLIVNARRHAHAEVSIILEQSRQQVRVHVDDDGEGIAPHERKRILDPFVRLESSRSRDSGGVGLGLTIVARIMEWHRGTVDISESPRKGARFTLILPCQIT